MWKSELNKARKHEGLFHDIHRLNKIRIRGDSRYREVRNRQKEIKNDNAGKKIKRVTGNDILKKHAATKQQYHERQKRFQQVPEYPDEASLVPEPESDLSPGKTQLQNIPQPISLYGRATRLLTHFLINPQIQPVS